MIKAKETWRDIGGFDGLYQISNHGRVKSFVKSRDGTVINGWVQSAGRSYKRRLVSLTGPGVRITVKIHRLVAESFIPKVDGKTSINHKDGNPLNNYYGNLEWCTQKENVDHAIKIGLRKVNAYGNENLIIEMYQAGSGVNEIVKEIGSSRPVINKIIEKHFGEVRGNSFYRNKYHIDRESLKKDLSKEPSNKVLAELYKTNSTLIARYRYLNNKGEL